MFLTQTCKTANFISIIFILFLIANVVQSVFSLIDVLIRFVTQGLENCLILPRERVLIGGCLFIIFIKFL